MPFNWRQPINYIYYQIIWVLLAQNMMLIYCGSILLFTGICRFLVVFCGHIKQSAQNLSAEIVQFTLTKETEKRVNLKIMFNDLVRSHCSNMQLSDANLIYIQDILFIVSCHQIYLQASWWMFIDIPKHCCFECVYRLFILESEYLWIIPCKCGSFLNF